MKNFLFLTMILAGMACTNSSDAQQKIQAQEFEKILKTDKTAQLIDVRTPGEFYSGHLSNARNIDISSSAFKNQIGQLDKNKPVLVYCASGVRSASAASQLKKMGFTKVYDLDGGIGSWYRQGKTIVK